MSDQEKVLWILAGFAYLCWCLAIGTFACRRWYAKQRPGDDAAFLAFCLLVFVAIFWPAWLMLFVIERYFNDADSQESGGC